MSVLIKALEKAQAEKAQAKKQKRSSANRPAGVGRRAPKKNIGSVTAKDDEISFENLSLSPPEIPLQESQPEEILTTSHRTSTPVPEMSIQDDSPAEPELKPLEVVPESKLQKVAVQRPNSKIGVERRAAQPAQAEAANVFTSKRIEATHQNAKLAIVAGAALVALLAMGVYFYRLLYGVSEPAPHPQPPHVVQRAPIPQPPQVAASVPSAPVQAGASSPPVTSAMDNKFIEKAVEPLSAKASKQIGNLARAEEMAMESSDTVEMDAPEGIKKGAVSKTVRVEKAIASESASIQVTRSKPQPGVNPLLLKAYESYNAGNDEEAQKLYKQVLLGDQLNVDAMLGLGAIATRQGRPVDAKAWYRKVLELDPRNGSAQAAMLDLQQQDSPQANETQIKAMLAKSPQDASLHAALGNLYAEQNRWPDAQQAYFEAYRLHQSAGNAYNLAASLDQMGKPKLALPYYQEALRLLPAGGSGINRATLEARISAIQ